MERRCTLVHRLHHRDTPRRVAVPFIVCTILAASFAPSLRSARSAAGARRSTAERGGGAYSCIVCITATHRGTRRSTLVQFAYHGAPRSAAELGGAHSCIVAEQKERKLPRLLWWVGEPHCMPSLLSVRISLYYWFVRLQEQIVVTKESSRGSCGSFGHRSSDDSRRNLNSGARVARSDIPLLSAAFRHERAP